MIVRPLMIAALLAAGAATPLLAATATTSVTLPSGTSYTDTLMGKGNVAAAGMFVTVHYTGWLLEGGKRGKKFDSSRDRNEPFGFSLGGGQVIAGWDEGVAGMKVGGRRTLIIPAAAGYGAAGAGADIPPNATLIFDIELLKAE